MKDFPPIPTPPAPQPPGRIRDMQDVWDFFAAGAPNPATPRQANPEGWRLQYLTRLQSHCGGAPLAAIFTGGAPLAEFDAAFPKARKGVHPRGDLGQDIETYKKWRRQCRRAIEIATGAAAEKAELRARRDGWFDLLAAIRLHCAEGGAVRQPAAASPVAALADIARRAGIEPRDLATDGVLDRLEAEFACPGDLAIARRAQLFLNKFRCLPEIAAALPARPAQVYEIRRKHAALPAHIDAYLARLAERAARDHDEVSGSDGRGVSEATWKGWLSALRHHVRTLPHCPPDPEADPAGPVVDLEAVNDAANLFAPRHLYATLRRTIEAEHLHGSISHVSAYNYYCDILRVLQANNPELDGFGDPLDPDAPTLLTAQTRKAIMNSRIMREGRELARGMTGANETWCKALVQDKARRNRFRRMHLTLMDAADAVLDAAGAEGRALADAEITRVRQLGTCAAACAIAWSGRPIRMGNMLGLRLHGARQNFFAAGPGRPDYSFALFADETKSGKAEPETPLNAKLGGPRVLAWYLAGIRPLFPHHETSPYLFPAIMEPGRRLGRGVFDTWFQRAASAAGLPMTFHRWRHGYASLLLSADWGNLPFAAQMLGNTAAVCARNYAWIDKERLILESQAKTVAAMEADR